MIAGKVLSEVIRSSENLGAVRTGDGLGCEVTFEVTFESVSPCKLSTAETFERAMRGARCVLVKVLAGGKLTQAGGTHVGIQPVVAMQGCVGGICKGGRVHESWLWPQKWVS